MSLTDTQRAIHAFIAERIEGDGFAPSQAEIARAFGFKGVRGAQYHLEALEAAGIVERSPGRARSLRVVGDGETRIEVRDHGDLIVATQGREDGPNAWVGERRVDVGGTGPRTRIE